MWLTPGAPVVFDCDGVVLGFDDHFPQVAQHALGLDAPLVRATNEYTLDLRYGITKAQMELVLDAYMTHPLGWAGLPLLEGAADVIAEIRDRGHPIHMVTGIDERMKELRLDNLKAHGIEVDSIHCVGMGHSSKADIIRQINPIVFVDDRLRLLVESSFVPHRVFIDHGDAQDGLVPGTDIHICKSLHQWYEQIYLPAHTPSHRSGVSSRLG